MPGIALSHPLYLLLLLPALALTLWITRASLAGLARNRARAVLGVRLLLLVLLVFTLAGPTLSFPSRALEVLFLLDRSSSVPPDLQARQLDLVNQAARHLPPDTRAGVVVFGRTAQVEQEPSPTPVLRQVHSEVGRDGTDLGAAVRLGTAVLSDNAQRRLVLVSDGNQTAGEAIREAAAAGVEIDVVPVDYRYPKEALLEKLVAPEQAKRGEPVEVRLIARSTAAIPAVVRLLRDGVLVAQRNWALHAGVNALAVPQTIVQPGFHTWEAVLEPKTDSIPQNNRALGFTHVAGEPRVLLVEGRPGEGALLENALKERSLRVERRSLAGLPSTQAEFQNFDSVLLVNVRADQVTPGQMRLLQSGVRDLGMGLLMVGGADSLTAGGWHGTPVEEALPVEMQVKRRQFEPDLALVLVIDRSSSMLASAGGPTKLAYAKEAAKVSLGALRPEDEAGVIGFAGMAEWIVPLRRMTAREEALGQIDRMEEGGGTDLYPALAEAHNALARSRAALKHVLVLTDGQSNGGDFDGIARRMARDRITISTVGIGADADGNLLSRLAALGKGRYYPAARANTLAVIFDREIRLASRSALVEEPFQPRPVPGAELIRGLPMPPSLLGYVATIAKDAPSVQVPLVSHRGEPLLASWRYGLGRAAVVTTDAQARWAAPWLAAGSGYFGAFWPQVVRSTLRSSAPDGLDVRVALNGDEGSVAVDALTPNGAFRNGLALQGRVAGPDGGQALRLEQVGLGRYEGKFTAPGNGQYLVSLAETARGTSPAGLTVAGAARPYPLEFASTGANTPLLLGLAERTGGKAWPSLGPGLHASMLPQLFRPSKTARNSPRDLWPYLLLGATLLLPLDVALRRLNLDRHEWLPAFAAAAAPVMARFRRPGPSGKQDPAMSRLLGAKTRASAPPREEAPASIPAAPSPPPAVPKPDLPTQADLPAAGVENNTDRLRAAKRRANRAASRPDGDES